ncbi:hypothetical protein M2151_001172 [Lachnospiraceae bacterium PH1-22]
MKDEVAELREITEGLLNNYDKLPENIQIELQATIRTVKTYLDGIEREKKKGR